MLTIIAAAILVILVVVCWDAVEETAIIAGVALLLAATVALIGFVAFRTDSPQGATEASEPVHWFFGVLAYLACFGVPGYWMWRRRRTTTAARDKREAEAIRKSRPPVWP